MEEKPTQTTDETEHVDAEVVEDLDMSEEDSRDVTGGQMSEYQCRPNRFTDGTTPAL